MPLISKPTRVVNETATLIDNIFCNILPPPDSSIILTDITDHFPILTHFSLRRPTRPIHSQPQRRRPTHENTASLGASLDNVDWSIVYNSEDVNLSFNLFMNIINEKLDQHIPLKKDKRNTYKTIPKLPWISASILRSINRKNNLFYKLKMKGTEQ